MTYSINHGVIEGRQPTDFVAGENSPLKFEVINPSGDWTKYLPTEEWQRDPIKPGTDKMNCVTQSFHNCIETIMLYDRLTGRMPDTHWNWLVNNGFIDKNGKPNFNDRIAATLNDTTPEGNWLYNVANKADDYGLFPETVLPSDESLSWNDYYNKQLITQAILNIGLESKRYFLLRFEWVNILDLAKHIQQAPLQIVKPGHAIEEITKPDPLKYFDTYKPFIKSIEASGLTSAMKHLVFYKEVEPMFQVKKVKVVIDNKPAWGVAVITPNMINISLAEDEVEWRSYSQTPGYGVLSVNPDGKTNWDVDTVINL
jgi:hypothetical protein